MLTSISLPVGHTATHCVLVAQLISQGKPRGVFSFIVQVRDLSTNKPLKGITIGEIGPKLGLDTVGQGFLGFDNVRIPHNQMLSKNAQVMEDGSVVKSAPDVLTYGTMTFTRVGLVEGSSYYLSMAATIAIRYSAVRKQSQINPNEPEVQIMDHLTQQYKLFPQLSKSVVFKFAAEYIRDMYNGVMADLERGHLDRLPELHALSCCLKSVTTTDCAHGVETLRLACGGHGYMASSSLSNIYGFSTAAQTYEGENTVLLLQTARYLMKTWKAAVEGKPLQPTVSYLSKVATAKVAPRFQNTLLGMAEIFQFSTGKMIQRTFENLERTKQRGLTNEESVNACSIELANAAEMHGRSFLLISGYLYTEKLVKKFSPELKKVIWDLVELFIVDTLLGNLSVVLQFVTLTQDDVDMMQSRLEHVLGRIRPNAVGIVDSFDFHDDLLNSTLGAYDGNVYERLFADAMKSPLNQEPVNQSFGKYLKPLMLKSKM